MKEKVDYFKLLKVKPKECIPKDFFDFIKGFQEKGFEASLSHEDSITLLNIKISDLEKERKKHQLIKLERLKNKSKNLHASVVTKLIHAIRNEIEVSKLVFHIKIFKTGDILIFTSFFSQECYLVPIFQIFSKITSVISQVLSNFCPSQLNIIETSLFSGKIEKMTLEEIFEIHKLFPFLTYISLT